MCLPMGINPQHDAGKSGNLLLIRYWAAHCWKWHMYSVRDACRNHSEMDTWDTVRNASLTTHLCKILWTIAKHSKRHSRNTSLTMTHVISSVEFYRHMMVNWKFQTVYIPSFGIVKGRKNTVTEKLIDIDWPPSYYLKVEKLRCKFCKVHTKSLIKLWYTQLV